jgi:hypothetical protein
MTFYHHGLTKINWAFALAVPAAKEEGTKTALIHDSIR